MTERRRRTVLLPTRSPTKKIKGGVPHGTENGTAHGDEISTWVQCEGRTCLKWRRITGKEADNLRDGEPWYCRMNRDVRYNVCTAREEKAKKPKHMKFVYSLLPVGDVVMARMSGYPPWPGLLTSDPSCDEYYDAPLDKEHQITHYHVEFLGTPRSHAWLVVNLVQPFASVPDVDKCPRFKNIQGRKLVEMKRSFDEAMVEARQLLKMNQAQRLATCRFTSFESNDKNGDLKLPTSAQIASAETSVRFEERTAKKSSRENEKLLLPIVIESRRTGVKSVKQPMKRGRKRKASYPVPHEETQCEQTVPEQSMSPASLSQEQCDQLPTRDFPDTRRSSVSFNSDCVPSSNPNSPLDLAVEFSSDSEDDSSTTFSCDMAEQELRYLERLLTALEPSLYPRSEEEESNKERRAQRSPVLTASCRNRNGQEEVDVTKTLDEIAEIEEEIAELDTFVALGLDKL